MTDFPFPLADVVIPESVFISLSSSPTLGAVFIVLDSKTNTWGATVTGGGKNKVFAWYNGSNWTVIGK